MPSPYFMCRKEEELRCILKAVLRSMLPMLSPLLFRGFPRVNYRRYATIRCIYFSFFLNRINIYNYEKRIIRINTTAIHNTNVYKEIIYWNIMRRGRIFQNCSVQEFWLNACDCHLVPVGPMEASSEEDQVELEEQGLLSCGPEDGSSPSPHPSVSSSRRLHGETFQI